MPLNGKFANNPSETFRETWIHVSWPDVVKNLPLGSYLHWADHTHTFLNVVAP